jgi:hypothetical protein
MRFIAIAAVLMFLATKATAPANDKLISDLSRVGKLSAELIDECKSDEDAVRVAVALTEAAKTIYLHIGGRELAAREFESVARLARLQP